MKLVSKIYKINNKIKNYFIIKKYKAMNIEKDITINGVIKIVGNGKKLAIGKNSTINSGKRANPIGGDVRTIFSIGLGEIIIGENVGISNSTFISDSRIEIENDVLIGGGCKFYDTDFHSLDFKHRILGKNDDDIKIKPIKVKEGAFIGASCICLKGVTIGKQSIIGAGSVITKDIPDFEIWAGNPARFIRKVKGYNI